MRLLLVLLLALLAYLYLRPSTANPTQFSPDTSISFISPTPYSDTLSYPIQNYSSRITVRSYGEQVVAADAKTLPCGYPFTGYHNGDDLEVTSAEQNQSVAVYAIAPGKVRQVGVVNGYGGFIAIQHTIDGLDHIANYGHLNLKSIPLMSGDIVEKGQKIGELGQGCTEETDNERKHLHFTLYMGPEVDVRGYVNSIQELEKFINPTQFLKSYSTSDP